MRTHHFIAVAVLLLFCCSGVECAQDSGKKEEKALVEAFVNLQDVPEPFAAKLAELKSKYDSGQFASGQLPELRQLTEELDKTYFRQETPDPSAIPFLIALIDADNSYDTVYGVRYFSLCRMTGVMYSQFHDGAFWKRWWEKNKVNYPEEVQKIQIPELPKTLHGKSYTPYPEKLETLDGLLELLCEKFEPKDAILNNNADFFDLGRTIAQFNDPKAIPYLIGAIDADNTYSTVYGLGHFALRDLTGVNYNVFHDGAFWRRWWEKNKANYPEEVQKIQIPELPKTEYGKTHTPYPIETETLQGQLLFFQSHAKKVKNTRWEDSIAYHPSLSGVARSIAELNDPTAILFLIAIIDYDSDSVDSRRMGDPRFEPRDCALAAGKGGRRKA